MDDKRFDLMTKSLSAGLTRRSLVRSLAAALGVAVIGAEQASAAPGGVNGKSKCYGAGSQCTNAKQCCSGTCSNRVCAPDAPPDPCAGKNCDDGNPCTTDACSAGICVHGFVTAGTPVGEQKPGDCLIQVCDGQGNITWQPDDTDKPQGDTNPCIQWGCSYGNVVGEPYPRDTPCGNGNICDGQGNCAPPVSGPCTGKPKNTPLSDEYQIPGDCQVVVCDGSGGTLSIPNDTDLPPAKPCVIYFCSGGQYGYNLEPAGTSCGDNLVCDPQGGCGPAA